MPAAATAAAAAAAGKEEEEDPVLQILLILPYGPDKPRGVLYGPCDVVHGHYGHKPCVGGELRLKVLLPDKASLGLQPRCLPAM